MTKTLRLTATALMIAAAGLMTACSTTEEALVAPGSSTAGANSALEALKLKLGAKRVELDLATAAKLPSTQATLTYSKEFCEDGSHTATAISNSYGNADYWRYYKFHGTAGDQVTITVNRNNCVFDAAFQLMYGSSTSTDGIGYGSVTSSDLTLIGSVDDSFTPVNYPYTYDCDCHQDPQGTYTLQQTGEYTIGVFDAGYCSLETGTRGYTIVVSGVSPCSADSDNDGINDEVDNCPSIANANQTDTDGDSEGDACDTDDDGDGVADATDNCDLTANAGQADFDGDGIGDACDPDDDNDGVSDDQDANDNSNIEPTVAIDGCSSGVGNEVVGNGNTMMDLINSCLTSAGNHGQFVSCVNQLANEWKAAGLITNQQKNAIGNCASSSNLP